MTDIVEFLTERYAEEQQLAESATPGPWCTPDQPVTLHGRPRWHVDREQTEGEPRRRYGVADCLFAGADAALIAAHDPARVLADLAAKQAILARHQPDDDPDGPQCTTCWGAGELDATGSNAGEFPGFPCDTLKLLAGPYTEHPDYDSAWRIDADH